MNTRAGLYANEAVKLLDTVSAYTTLYTQQVLRLFPAGKADTIRTLLRRFAKERRLYLSEADGRNFDGSPRYPSRFVLDIGRDCIAFTHPPQEGLIRETEDYIAATQRFFPAQDSDTVFPVGQRVKHLLFGEGTVLEVDRDNGAHLVQFDDMPTPRKISFRAKLERC